jgi:membrane protein
MESGFHKAFRFLKRLYHNFKDSGALQHAGTIAYFGLLAIVPMTIIISTVVGGLVSGTHVGSDEYSSIDAVLDQLERALPFLAGDLRERLEKLAAQGTGLSLASGVLLLYGASSGFTALDRGINGALNTQHKTRFILTKLLFAGVFVALAASLYLLELVRSFLGHWFSYGGLTLPGWADGSVAQWLVTLGLLTIAFVVVLGMVATEHHSLRMRVAAGLGFALMFQAARLALTIYLDHVSVMESLYGTAAAFVGLILWLYIASILLLFTCSVMRTVGEKSGV